MNDLGFDWSGDVQFYGVTADDAVQFLREAVDEETARAVAAEAKLAKAVEALGACVASIEHGDMSDGFCCCGEKMDSHSDPMSGGHTPTDMGEYYAFLALKNARAVLAELEGKV
jgi:hypothetical protein